MRVKYAGECGLAQPPSPIQQPTTDDNTVVELDEQSHSSGVKNATISSRRSSAGRAA
ncbi:MAG: hypothetical protein NZM04_05330 [Methylacidiphilales bacterium]|nr:hypothetical protein [Candidatus Methylacidiphilales bacterium]